MMTETMIAQVARVPPFSFPTNRHGRPPREPHGQRVAATSLKKQHSVRSFVPEQEEHSTRMPVSASSPIQTTFPSFMSVFGNGASTEANASFAQSPSKPTNGDKRTYLPSYTASIRRDSTSTFESTESSPTTTISTVASSLTEPSPNSSPESPNLTLKLAPRYPRRVSDQDRANMERNDQFSNSFPTLPGIEKLESPQKKMRNMKNLSVNTSASNRPATSLLPKLGLTSTAAPPPHHASSAPPTPAFIVPPKAPRRKPSNLGLSIATPDPSTSNPPARPSIVPQTPSDPQMKTLRRLQTSLDGSLQSPTVAPEGGMRLPPFNNTSSAGHFGKAGPPLSISPSSMSSPLKKQTLEHVKEEPDYEVPLSQEVKSPAYPQGPVCIYDPNIYLYLEPTKIEASEFDVVFNVAREVKNPFVAKEPSTERKMVDKGVQVSFDTVDKGVQASFDDFGKEGVDRQGLSEPQTATSELAFSSTREAQSDKDTTTSPSTPRANRGEPEYIHIPWDHNTNLVEDLLRLCELIDDRVRQNKKILIHCQCGVSRSASLVVAYGMYKNPNLSVQEAYAAVKDRSRWIGPNMNLIYQLSEFKSKLATSVTTGLPTRQSLRGLGSERPDHGPTITPDTYKSMAGQHRGRAATSASALAQSDRLSSSAPNTSHKPPGSAQLLPPIHLGDVSPGPMSAPPACQTTSKPKEAESGEPDKIKKPLSLVTDLANPVLISGPPEQSFSPTVHETRAAPAGAVASDLRRVAEDLDQSGKSNLTGQIEGLVKEGSESATIAPPGSWPQGETESPHLASKSSLSSLKIGFSRLFSRQDLMPPLPIRQNAPRFTATGQAAGPFNSFSLDDVPPTPSLLSPRAADFTASPFHRTAAGDLAGSSTFEQGLMSPRPVDEDPRSPHQRGEAPITRSIFDMI